MPQLFPLRRFAYGGKQPPPPTDQYDPLQMGQSRRRRSLFGGPARGIVRREDGDPGTLVNYLLFGRQGVSGMREDRMNRDLFPFAVRREKLEQAQAEREDADAVREQEARDAAIAALPESEQAWARLNPEMFAQRQNYAWQRQYDAENPEPITPFQQAQLDLQRRGQSLDYQRSMMANQRPPELSYRDAIRVGEASTAARQARTVRGLAQEFLSLNQRVPTGQLSSLRPDQWWNTNRERMRQITDQLTPMMREPGTGSMSDGDRQMFANAVPRVGVQGAANQRAGDAMIQGARNMEDYASYLDMYSESGDLRGAEQNWNVYLNANPVFDRYGNVRSDRPSFEEWLAAGQPDMSSATAPSSAGAAATDDEIMDALARGRGGRESIDELSRRSMEEHRVRRQSRQPPARLSGVERGF